METSKVVLDLGGGRKILMKFSLPDEDDEIDLDKLLMIDVAHLAAEIATIPIALNKFGLLLADATNNYNQAKLRLSIYEAEQRTAIRNDVTIKDKKTELFLEDKITSNKGWQALKKSMINKQKEMEYVSSIYWSLKSKDDKLNKLSMSVQSGDVYDQLVACQLKRINMVDLKIIKPAI